MDGGEVQFYWCMSLPRAIIRTAYSSNSLYFGFLFLHSSSPERKTEVIYTRKKLGIALWVIIRSSLNPQICSTCKYGAFNPGNILAISNGLPHVHPGLLQNTEGASLHFRAARAHWQDKKVLLGGIHGPLFRYYRRGTISPDNSIQ